MKNKNTSSSDNGKGNVSVTKSAFYSGPVPDPLSLEKYEKIQPGFANRLITMDEKEQQHS